jgi:signal peptidase I
MTNLRLYSLRKCRHILKSSYKWYKKKGNKLPPSQLAEFETLLQNLDIAVLDGIRTDADSWARKTEEFCHARFKKGLTSYAVEMVVAILIALVVATLVRQTWFELYEIPTGSMRPTFREQDHLTVTKTVFGINVPLQTKHFFFDPNLVQRTSVVIWSGDHVPHLDSDSSFMGIFPYTKRYIKRCMGKPGDTLYFYGGRIYGFDKDGNDLKELRNNPWTANLEYIPFTNFEGRRTFADERKIRTIPETIFHHFNRAIGKMRFFNHNFKGEVFNGRKWVVDDPEAQRTPHMEIKTFSDFWGIRNFAMARLLDKDQLESFTPYQASEMEDGILYLELRHTPSLSYPSPFISNRFVVALKGYSTVIPLQENHLNSLMDTLYTCRFIIKDGKGTAYRMGTEKFTNSSPLFPKTPNGTYEFYNGKGVSIGWGGITTALPSDHPLYSRNPSNIQRIFNVGIDMNTLVEPHTRNQPYFPNRYTYFRDGSLYIMGGLVIDKEDPILKDFHEREIKKEKASTTHDPYVAFKDYGPPLTPDGKLDNAFIDTFGLKIPERHYLMLGDNHAMSQDSRYFGPVPQDNLQGAPSLIIWPPGERWGTPNQKPYPLFTSPRLIVWSIVGLICLVWFIIHQYNKKKPTFKKLY